MADKPQQPTLRRELHDIVSALSARQRRLLMLTLMSKGLFYGGICAALVAVIGAAARAAWLRPVPWPALACIAALAAAGAVLGLIRRPDPLKLAHALDQAASSEDRFASALQLVTHHRRERVRMVAEDALSHVADTRPESALPWRTPREIKWLPVPVLVVAAACWLAPGPRVQANPAANPEITADEWKQMHEEFRKELKDLDEAATPEEKEIRRQLERLIASLADKPEKKDVLAQIARLQADLKRRQLALGTRDVSMRKAAAAMRGEKPLDKLAAQLREGQYRKSAEEMRAIAEKLAANKLSMTAAEFEAAAQDFEQMSNELASHEELSQACRECSNSAASMNRDKLSESLKKLSKCVDKNCDDMRKCDACRSCDRTLDDLRRRLAGKKPCGNCNKPGCAGCSAFVKNNDKKGGLKAGWGTASKWDGGTLSKKEDQRLPVLAQPHESDGANTALSTVSPEERAASGQNYKEVYVEMVRKAEADLALEEVPLAYRDYLRRYFQSIVPKDETPKQEEHEEQ